MLLSYQVMSNSSGTPWTVPHLAPQSLGFPRQEWSGLSFSSPGHLPNPLSNSASPALQADSLPLGHQGSPSTVTDRLRSQLSIWMRTFLMWWGYLPLCAPHIWAGDIELHRRVQKRWKLMRTNDWTAKRSCWISSKNHSPIFFVFFFFWLCWYYLI